MHKKMNVIISKTEEKFNTFFKSCNFYKYSFEKIYFFQLLNHFKHEKCYFNLFIQASFMLPF